MRASESVNAPTPVPGEDFPYDNLPSTRRLFDKPHPLRVVYERGQQAFSDPATERERDDGDGG